MHGRNRSKYIILGAGISGLALAWFLKKSEPDCELVILEKQSKAGGWIQTNQTFGYLFELGPHILRLTGHQKEVCENLFEDLDLSEQIIEPESAFKSKYLAHDNKLCALKLSPLQLLNPKNYFPLTFPLLKSCFSSSNMPSEDISIGDFSDQFFGPHVTRWYMDPLVMGIYGHDIYDLSLRSCFPAWSRLFEDKKPLVVKFFKQQKKQQERFVSFRGGMRQLVKELEKKLSQHIIYDVEINQLQKGVTSKVYTHQCLYEGDHIISTLPAYSLSGLMEPFEFRCQTFLENLSFTSYKVVHLGYSAQLDLPRSFGYISPSWADQKISGVIFDSMFFKQQNFHSQQTRLTALIADYSPLYKLNGATFKKAFFDELNTLLNIHVEPQYYEIFNTPNAIAQYKVGHQAQLDKMISELRNQWPGFRFAGASFFGVSVPSCIAHAQTLAQELVNNAALSPSPI